jgi:hypothetical protein
MSQSYKDFLKKYNIDDFKTKLQLTGRTKIDFYNDIDKLLRSMCTIFDKLSNIAPMRGRLEKLKYAFNYLENAGYIKIEKKTEKFHIIKLNEEDNPDLAVFREIVQKYWKSPLEEKEKIKKWSEEI